MLENKGPAGCPHIFCAGITPLQLVVVLIWSSLNQIHVLNINAGFLVVENNLDPGFPLSHHKYVHCVLHYDSTYDLYVKNNTVPKSIRYCSFCSSFCLGVASIWYHEDGTLSSG